MAIDKLEQPVRPNVVQSRTDRRRQAKPKPKRKRPPKNDQTRIDEFA